MKKRFVRCKKCGKEFWIKEKNRLRITKKLEKGEAVLYLCPDCGKT